MTLLDVNDLEYSIAGTKILRSISLKLEEGKVYGLVGESGCGKTTFARIVCGMIRPDSGRVKFRDQVLTDLNPFLYRQKQSP